jgi:hypothetical protein
VESQSLYQDVPPVAPAEKASVVEDFVDIFYAPSKVFERRRDGKFGIALLILFVLMIALFFATRAVMQPIYDVMIDQQVAALQAKQPGATPEQLAGMRGMMEKTFMIAPLFGVPMIVLVVGVVLWLVGKLFDSKQTFGQAMAVSTYAQVPRFVLGSLIAAVMAFASGGGEVTSPFAYSIGLARFAPEGSSMMMQALLNRFELFTLWATFLLGLGLSITGQVPKRQAFIAAGIVWLLATLMAAMQGLAGG